MASFSLHRRAIIVFCSFAVALMGLAVTGDASAQYGWYFCGAEPNPCDCHYEVCLDYCMGEGHCDEFCGECGVEWWLCQDNEERVCDEEPYDHYNGCACDM